MDLAPPPQAGSGIEDFGDRLVVHFRTPHRWSAAVSFVPLLAVWIYIWIEWLKDIHKGTAASLALLVFVMCIWALAGVAMTARYLFHLFGRKFLVVTAQELEVRKELGRYVRTKTYEAALVEDVRAGHVPTDDGDRADFCLQVKYRGKRIPIGEGMHEREAELAAVAVLERIRPRRRWGDETRRYTDEPNYEPIGDDHGQSIARSMLFPALIVAALAWLGVQTLKSPSHPRTPAATDASQPRPDQFANPRGYAEAISVWTLSSSKYEVVSPPSCEHVTWENWLCRVRAKAPGGPYAGRPLIYRCYPLTRQQDGRPVRGTLCGTEHPPPLTYTAGP